MASPIDVHFWPTPNGHKVTIALEEMGLPYTIVPINISKGDQFKPDFLAISPNNRMPAIVDPEGPDGRPISVFESGAILQYLARKSGLFGGRDARQQVDVEQWLFWQMAGLGPMAGQANHFRTYAPTFIKDQRQVAYGAIRYTNEVERLYGVMESRLKDRDYFAGDYSIADMAIWPWSLYAGAAAVDLAQFPAVKAWRDRVGDRDAVKRAVAMGEASKARVDLAASGKEAEDPRNVLFGQRAR